MLSVRLGIYGCGFVVSVCGFGLAALWSAIKNMIRIMNSAADDAISISGFCRMMHIIGD